MQSPTPPLRPGARRQPTPHVPHLSPHRIWPTLPLELREAALREVSQMILALARSDSGLASTTPAAPEAAHDSAR